jgi:hypothetical protein
MNRNDKIRALEQALRGNSSTLQKYQASRVIYSHVLENSLLCQYKGSHPEAIVTVTQRGSNFHYESSLPELSSGVYNNPEIEVPLFI